MRQHVVFKSARGKTSFEHKTAARNHLGKYADVPGIGMKKRHRDVPSVAPVEMNRRLDDKSGSEHFDVRARHPLRHARRSRCINNNYRAEIIHSDPVAVRHIDLLSFFHRFVQPLKTVGKRFFSFTDDVNIFRTNDVYIFHNTLHLFERTVVDDQKRDARLFHHFAQDVSPEAGIDGKKNRVAQGRSKRSKKKFRRIFHINPEGHSLIVGQFAAVDQFFSDRQEKMRIALRLPVNIPVGKFAAFKNKKNAMASRPHPP
ncbi:MAG: hypothetical protein BWX55_00715 [Deltaproteobacteria bacterium ADurb.Bin022]|nr:MAG: hypothetical protein BWX55_00715 [Deltaproteobacteria bacterium ADurb.Bin022]